MPIAYCLGQPSHVIPDKAVVCSTCHCLKAQVTIGHYQVLQRIGKGRSGDVYKVEHLGSHQPAVLKLFPPDNGSRPLWEAARREIRTVTALRYPTILPIFQCTLWNLETQLPSSPISSNMRAIVTQEYLLTFCQLAPFSLAQVIEGGLQAFNASSVASEPLAWILSLVITIGDTLSLTHSLGIKHGALVPGNIVYAPGHFWVADFGLASLHPPFRPYLAPELESEIQHAQGDQKILSFWRARSSASDQYSLAMTYKQLFGTLLPQAINDHTTPILHKALNTNPLNRFENIAQMTQALIPLLIPQKSSPPAQQQEPTTPVKQDSGSVHIVQTSDWEERGNKAFRAHDYELAVQAYQQATTLDTQNPLLWAALGDSFFAINKHKDAVDAYDQALRLNPIQPAIWVNRGTALEQLGRTREALACYERASRLRKQN